ncbi:MAG: hypothetical protein CL943_01860 [Candidatus Diapherotrites archaeon]|uniref:DUF116 domain-containing protein n=1 Tax=Candidatus Iainarchaeum sp. TaxID=3101447 RepID=A0A2D6M0T2_9ARCH|nr:hypothetical protein [Candidatus Diapherotrites archaeon]|tara:strand:- start:23856 stop:24419 length:564 start_codon:yes stop_codon:yes gene_type:complete
MSSTSKIKEYIAILADKTTHLDVAKTTQAIAKKFGLSDRLVNYTHIELRNKMNEFGYRRIPFKDRALFIPHCLKNSAKCKAPYGDEGLECQRCGKCQITDLIGLAKEIGYGYVFVCPGGSMVQKLVQKYKPKAVLGVCCYDEANMGFEKFYGTQIAPQAALLLYDGCKDTKANLIEVREKMMLIDKN